MKKRYKNTFRNKILEAVRAFNSTVILRADLKTYGGARQLSRALKALVEDGELIKFGYGVYVKAEKTPYGDKPVMTVSMAEACAEALKRLGVRWKLGKAIEDYNRGLTQQVPVKVIVRLKNRFRGRLGTGNRTVVFEGGINAK